MLKRPAIRQASRQQGIVLLMAIIVLVALTLGALALTRSVYTANVIAGNLAFQRAATHSAEQGIETAFRWLEANADTALNGCEKTLQCTQPNDGYSAMRLGDIKDDGKGDESPSKNWEAYWDAHLAPIARKVTQPDGTTKDDADNLILYAIERMCTDKGETTSGLNTCTTSPIPASGTCSGGSSCSGGEGNIQAPPSIYYRITVRVEGPHNTRSMVQAMVAF